MEENLKVGDIFLNPIMQDLWILRKDIFEDEEEESWVLALVHSDYVEKYDYVNGFIKIGNIYEIFSRIDKAIEYCDLNIEFTPRLEDIKNILLGEEKYGTN